MDRSKLDKWNSENFNVVKLLGKGSYGSVYLVRSKQPNLINENKQFALKVLNKKHLHSEGLEVWARREIEIQSHLNHPNIVRCYGFSHDSHNLYLVLEYMESSIYNELQRQPYNRFSEKQSASIMWYVSKAVEYIHALSVIHRDIKPANLLINSNGNVKLADFGMAVHTRNEKRETFCGSKAYIAPEIFQKKPYSQQVDIWSMGILCHELLTGKRPEQTKEQGPKISILISNPAKQLIMALLEVNPIRRMQASAINKHPWILSHVK